jgi:ABC-2 type transport system ATP-binding protein
VLLLDEPANGLDPEGIAWLRQFLRWLASQGRTVLVSSHVLSEVEQTVDDVVIIARGRLVHASSLAGLEALARPAVRIGSPDAAGLAALVAAQGWGPLTRFDSPTSATVLDVRAAQVGAAAFAAGLELHELSPADTSLESLFLQLTADPGPPGSPPVVPGAAGTPGPAGTTLPGVAR